MEIVHQYQRKRRDFGRQCNFTERKPDVIADILPDPSLRSQFVYRNPVDSADMCAKEFSEHEVCLVLAPTCRTRFVF